MRYLPREAAPFGGQIWPMLEGTVLGAARSQLAGRRLLEVTGPLGFGVRAIGKVDRAVEGAESEFHGFTATMTNAAVLPLPMLRAGFRLSIRDVAAAEETGNPVDLADVALAAIALARLEDQLIFFGNEAVGLPGVMNVEGATASPLGDWDEVGTPIDDLIAATTALDEAGFPGPYTAALSPPLYNALFRVYEGADLTQLEHARQIITSGIIKATTLAEGGVVVAEGKQFAQVVIAQDLTVAFVGPQETDYEFALVESLAPRISVPPAICVLGGE